MYVWMKFSMCLVNIKLYFIQELGKQNRERKLVSNFSL